MKKYLIIIGNFGSGKTELALNIAFEAAETKKVTFVDLDIVNPYFRSTERKAELEAAGIRLLSPSFTNLGVEVPSLPAEIFSAFSDNSDLVIFDVGGDDTGAIALGQYHRFFSKIDRSAIEVLYVVNARRPFSAELESNLDMIEKVTGAGRIEIDALVNNAGITKDGLMVRMSEEQYDAVIAVNQKSVFNMMKLVGAVMMRQRHGRIVSLASVAGLYGNPGQINYSASKAAIIGMTKTVAKELGARNVTVNAVAPGFIKTPMTDALTEEQRNKMLELVSMKRYGNPEEVASVISFLCSDNASYVTGQTIEISGGLMM